MSAKAIAIDYRHSGAVYDVNQPAVTSGLRSIADEVIE